MFITENFEAHVRLGHGVLNDCREYMIEPNREDE